MISLSESAPSRGQKRLIAVIGLLLLTITAVTLPFAQVPLAPIAAFLPAYGTALVLADLITAYLLLIQFRQTHTLSMAFLAAAYLYSGLIVLPQLLVFPGVVTANGLLGAGSQSAVWLWVFWHGGFPFALLCYAGVDWQLGQLRINPQQRLYWTLAILAGVPLLVTGITLLCTHFQYLLPAIVAKGNYAHLITSGIGPAVWLLNLLALWSIWEHFRGQTTINLWLLLAVLASLCDVSLTLFAASRYCAGWYVARINSLLSSFFLLAMLLFEINRLYASLALVNQSLSELANLDSLSGLANRRCFDDRLLREWKSAQRGHYPVSLLMIDIDQFKVFNDTYGHPAGDACLRKVAQVLRQAVMRPEDLAFRYGGEEFGILLPATSARGALKIAERVRQAVEKMAVPNENAPPLQIITLSIGTATLKPTLGSESGELIRAADQALYMAKHGGRNRVESAGLTAPTATAAK